MGNSSQDFRNTTILNVSREIASRVVTSDDLDELLKPTYQRVGLRAGMVEKLAGIRERRWWPEGTTFIDGAATVATKALSEAGIEPDAVGLMVNTSVSRRHLEPSTAVAVHDAIGLPSSCQNFDVTNACLGFVNGIQIAGAMIDVGAVDYALVVNAEDSQTVQEATVRRLAGSPATTKDDVVAQFATLTLGSGASAMLLGPADRHPEGHRVVTTVSRAGTAHHELCLGDNDAMSTDLRGLLDAGLQLSEELWAEAATQKGWDQGIARYVVHQVSQVHTNAMCTRLGIDPDLVPRSFPVYGNIGPVSVPFTLAGEVDSLDGGDRVLLMGIGSGLNASVVEIQW